MNEPREPYKSTFLTQTLPIVIAVVALVGFVGVVWYAYQQGKVGDYENVVPTIRAESESFKTRPDDPGGMDIPNQGRFVFNQEDSVEQLVGGAAASAAKVEAAVEGMKTPSEDLAPTSVAVEELTPLAVEEVPTIEPLAVIEEPLTEVPAVPAPAKEVVAVKTPAIPAGAVWRVQLISVKSEKSANKAKAKYGQDDHFSAFPVYVVQADLGKKGTYYRVQVGDFGAKSDAKDLCDTYKAAGKSCLVVKHTP